MGPSIRTTILHKMHTFFIFFGLLAGAFAFEGVLDVETRDELGSIRDRLKSCFGIEKWVWMTKMNNKADVENCVKTVTGADDAGPYLQCIGLKTGWYKAGGWSKPGERESSAAQETTSSAASSKVKPGALAEGKSRTRKRKRKKRSLISNPEASSPRSIWILSKIAWAAFATSS